METHGSPSDSADALDAAVRSALRAFARVDDDWSRVPARPGGWSARQILGHLIDSACNNHRRFVVGQLPGLSRLDGYAQDDWVARQGYQGEPWQELVELWAAYNRHLAHVMRQTTAQAADASALAPDGSGPLTVGFLMADYVSHLRHHVAQIVGALAAHPPAPRTGWAVAPVEATRPAHAVICGVRHDVVPIDADAHAAALFAGTSADERMWTYLWYGPFADVVSMAAWLRSCQASTDPLFFAVVDRASGTPVGMCSLMRVDTEMRVLELGHIWYVPSAQGTGVNADMALTLLTACFERWGYRRVEWKCDALNTRSRAAALKLGFTFEGLFRQHMVRKGRNRDTAWFSLVDADWPAAKARLELQLGHAAG